MSDPKSSEIRPRLQSISLPELWILLSAVVFCYCVLYGPQVILNQWIIQYELSAEWASALVYITLLPMSFAPLSYGYFLSQQDTAKLIGRSLIILSLSTLGMAFAQDAILILVCRFLQGLILPVIMTSVMSRLSSVGGQYGKKLISYYLCATVLGGLVGRLITGYFNEWFSLETLWMIWAVCIVAHVPCLALTVKSKVPFNRHKIDFKQMKRICSSSRVKLTLMISALMFGVFAAALNILPLRATELGLGQHSSSIANRYWGYIGGVIIAIYAQSLDQALGRRGYLPTWGMLLMAIALVWGTFSLSYAPLYIMVLGLCIGLFMTHPILAAFITQLNPNERGLMSGLYVSSYYIGGVIFSIFSSFSLGLLGWRYTLYILTLFAFLGAYLTRKLFQSAE